MQSISLEGILSQENQPLRSILIFGPPGSGKGTLGKSLSSLGNHCHLSSGEIFRGLLPESPVGQLFHQFASKGELVPDEVTMAIWHRYVQGLIATNVYFPCKQLLLLDGLPRTLNQTDLIQPYLEVVQIISLEMPNIKGLVARLKGRAIKEGRMDDFDENIVQNRLKVYENETAKILNRYPKELVAPFNADQPPLDVLKDVLMRLSHLLR